jgi:ParB family chromosome partitioning protein
MTTRRALGKGIEALIPHRVDRGKEILEIPLDSIVPNRYQPRKNFADEPFRQLVESIKANGVIQPVIVTRGTDGWELVAGERRWRAAREAGLPVVPAIVRETGPTDKLVLALIENLLREDLNPIEKANSFGELMEFGVTQEDVAARLGLSRPAVANYLRLLALPSEVIEAIRTDKLTFGHAKVLAGLSDAAMVEAASRVVAKGLSVRETEALVRRLKEAPPVKKGTVPKKPSWAGELEDEFRRRLGARVTVTPRGKGGEIKITCRTGEELDRLITILRSKGDSR